MFDSTGDRVAVSVHSNSTHRITVLTIEPVTLLDSGRYACRAGNIYSPEHREEDIHVTVLRECKGERGVGGGGGGEGGGGGR